MINCLTLKKYWYLHLSDFFYIVNSMRENVMNGRLLIIKIIFYFSS